MRLLKRLKDGGVELSYHPPDDIPAYAILSHTWGKENQEVILCDIQNGVGQRKAGFKKIDFCGKQSAADGLEYFWVDSCCIDKSSSAELQEAITSMFRWYRRATKCYVYLSDVMSNQDKQHNNLLRPTWEPAFRKSRWFTRGWTLQELLAPQSVEFFSEDGDKLGDKASLDQLLNEITGIAIDALRGVELSSFGIEERMLWSKDRKTAREEDKAYSLFGIFNVSMFINYGEGVEMAMERLREAIQRRLDSLEKSRNGVITEDNILESLNFLVKRDREDDIEQSAARTFEWIFDSNTSNFADWLKNERAPLREKITAKSALTDKSGLFWIKGKPGSGKSTLMKYIRGHPKTESLVKEWAQDATVLCTSYYFWYKGKKVLSRYDQTGNSKLKFCFFIDGLDEYAGDHEELVKLVIKIAGLPHVKLCVSSRPLNAFEREFGLGLFPHIVLQELTSGDIRRYVEEKFNSSPEMERISTQEPKIRSKLKNEITRKASGVFIWVVLVVKLLLEGAKDGDSGSVLEKHLDSYPDEIDELYQLIIGRVNKAYLSECFKYLRFVEATGGSISLLLLTVACEESISRKVFDDETQLQDNKKRINSRCLGLLEVKGKGRTGDGELAEESVGFLHKSVFDYLKTDGALQHFKKFEHYSWILELKLMEATLRLLDIRYPEPVPIMRLTWFKLIRPHAMTFLSLARALEEKSITYDFELIDKLNKKATELWKLVYP
ncbi:heterokaryon incompatibility protein-domain-containing protein [Xylaria sp. FL1042]|nr:heterokaryon incompatibility protein-domain-containing protein [Xylaria sp. FL1042]